MKKSQQRRASITKNILYLAGKKTHGRTTSFAKLVGISVKQAHDILEKGVIPKLDTLIKIAETFEIQLEDIITDKPTKKEIDSNLVELIVLQISNDPANGEHGILYKSPLNPGIGNLQ